MIEGANLSQTGIMVKLARGSLIMNCLVVWSVGSRRGLRFSESIDVQQWRGLGRNVQQQRVDDVVRLVRTGARSLPSKGAENPRQGPQLSFDDNDLVQDLRRVSDLLDQLGDVLTSDPAIIDQHGSALQSLDIASQVIAAMVKLKTAHCSLEDGSTTLAGLRRSADQALSQAA